MTRTLSRRALVLGPVFMALLVAAQPAAAWTPISQTGEYGPYEILDTSTNRGAKCIYEGGKTNGKNVLDRINVRPPLNVHSYDYGTGNPKQWVGWRYIIQRDTNFDNNFSDLYKSSWVKAKASESVPAQFARRTWYASENPKGNYRVRIVIRWFEPGSKTVQSGKVVAHIEYYRVIKGSSTKGRLNSCYRDWQGS